jgi:ferric-dicitrate binding protein FerR (iron transport regulator)
VKPPEDLDLDRVHALMMAALDRECGEAERRELEALLSAHPELADEWNRLCRLKEVTVTMGLRQPPEEVWDRYRGSVLHRAERGIAWSLIAFGGAVLALPALWHAIEEWLAAEMPPLMRVGSAALFVGVVVLLVSIGRERWFLHRRDPYKEVTR